MAEATGEATVEASGEAVSEEHTAVAQVEEQTVVGKVEGSAGASVDTLVVGWVVHMEEITAVHLAVKMGRLLEAVMAEATVEASVEVLMEVHTAVAQGEPKVEALEEHSVEHS